MSYTAGPWKSINNDYRVGSLDADGLVNKIVCVTAHNYQERTPEAQFNARLIAAAPTLLEACKRAKKLLEPEVTKEPDRTIFWELVEAITKAEGRS